MKRKFITLTVAVLSVVGSFFIATQHASAATGLHISGTNIVEANGKTFIMRGVSHEHTWFANQTSSFANIKAAGANTVRVVLSGGRWTANSASDVANVVSLCKTNRLICVLEDHDTTGYGEDTAAYSLDQAVDYWIGLKDVLAGQENYIVINIGNEPIGNTNPGQWTDASVAAVKRMRSNGFQHLLMVDAPNWGQDWSNTMRDNAQPVLDADSQHNTVLSIHMYDVYNTAAKVKDYLDQIQAKNWPLVIGEFGWQQSASNVDDQAVMAESVARGLGYIGWSWAGNNDPYLDMATNFDPTQLSTWGVRIFNGTNGIKATAKEATIYGGATNPTTPPVTTPPATTPVTSPPATTTPPTGTKACTATYSIQNQWTGGFQGEVRVTAGTSAISKWTVSWTLANGQSITQSWNATVTSSGSTVTARNVSYNGSVAAGASTSFGFLGAFSGTNAVPAVSCSTS
ncbi:MAG TPA: cellulase family glycosylhydrolase [Kineosporiaceae bacterium]|nr:cellulase family glycosylhydrolase [Kineosporiaceae bacterium]